MVRTSYLRVYQPLDSFPEAERKRFASAGRAPQTESRTRRAWLVHSAMPSPAVEYPAGLSDGAFVRTVDEAILVCPWRTRLRMLAGLIAFRVSVPVEVADAFVPANEAERAAAELEIIGERYPDVRSHIVHANWHVPLRWFSAFDDSERILTEDADGLRVRYETKLGDAQARLGRALRILEETWIDESVTEAVRELVEWIADFPEDGLLELDYGSVAGMFPDDLLVEDRTAAEVWTCLDALAAGDVVGAGRTFSLLSDRWAELRSQEAAN